MSEDKQLVLSSEPTAMCMRRKPHPYQRNHEYIVFVDNDIHVELGCGCSPYGAWKDAAENIRYIMVWKLEQ